MHDVRKALRAREAEAEGLLLAFIGKMPGLAARLAPVLAHPDRAADGGDEPREMSVEAFARAAHLIESCLLPMARRAHAGASVPRVERAAVRLVALIREHGGRGFPAATWSGLAAPG